MTVLNTNVVVNNVHTDIENIDFLEIDVIFSLNVYYINHMRIQVKHNSKYYMPIFTSCK